MRITLASGTPAEIARPAVDGGRGLVIAPDIWGLRPLFDEMAARLAEQWQCTAVVVDPFPNFDLPMELEPRWKVIATQSDGDRFTDFTEAANATGAEHVAMIGFCVGGMYANKSSSLSVFDKLVSFYGMIRVPSQARSAGQHEPLELIEHSQTAAAKLLAIIGDLDPYTPPDDVTALEAIGVTAVHYPDADHAFVHDPSRPSHRADDAADAWQRTAAWLWGQG